MKVYFYNNEETQYSITENGKVYNRETKKWLKGQIGKHGYRSFNLSLRDGKKRLYCHRLVAETFLPNKENKEEVNHKNGDKDDNRVENLEWVSSSENKQHAISLGLINNRKPVYRFDKNRQLVQVYISMSEVIEKEQINGSWLSEQLKREVKTLSHDSYWSYSPDPIFSQEKRKGVSKKVAMFYNGEKIDEFASRNECSRKTGFDKKAIGECCNGKRKSYNGHTFIYIDEDIV